MSKTSWPYINQPTSDEEYSALFSLMQDNGIVNDPGSNDLSGSADSTGMTVRVAAGEAFIRGYYYRNTDTVTLLTIAPATGTARTDRVVLRLNVAEPNANNRISLAVLQGVTTTPPKLTQVEGGIWEEPLFLVNVGANMPNVPNSALADERRFVGHVLGRWPDDNHRPLAPQQYQAGFNSSRGYIEMFKDGQWSGASANWADISNKPGTYPPSAHTHTFSSLTSRPDTYPPSQHTHSVSDLTDYPGQLDVAVFSAGEGYGSGAVVSGGTNITMQSLNVTVPPGKDAIIEAFAKAFVFLGASVTWAANLSLLVDGVIKDSTRFHNHGKSGYSFPTASFTYALAPGTHTIALQWRSESASAQHELWDTDSRMAILWPR